MILKIQKFSFSTVLVLFPILYFNSCTFEFIKPYSFTLPLVGVFLLAWLLVLAKEINVKVILPMAVYAFCLLVLWLVGAQLHRSVLLSDISNALYMLIFMCVFTIYSGEQYKNDRALIVFVWFVDTIIACVYSVYRLINEPLLARQLSTGSYHNTDAAVAAKGVVSYGVIYGLVLVILALFYLVLQSKNKRFVNICLISMFFVLLIMAQFVIALGLVAIGMLWMVLLKKPKNEQDKWYRAIFLIVFGPVFIISLPYLLKILVDSEILGYEINARMQEIVAFLEGGDFSGVDTAARLSQYARSITAFFASFCLGKMVVPSVEVGTHSEWLDGFGNYGIMFLLYLVAIWGFCRFVLEKLPNKKSKQLYSMLFVIYAIMSVINTSAWAPITLSLCVIVPFICVDKVGGHKERRLL